MTPIDAALVWATAVTAIAIHDHPLPNCLKSGAGRVSETKWSPGGSRLEDPIKSDRITSEMIKVTLKF